MDKPWTKSAPVHVRARTGLNEAPHTTTPPILFTFYFRQLDSLDSSVLKCICSLQKEKENLLSQLGEIGRFETVQKCPRPDDQRKNYMSIQTATMSLSKFTPPPAGAAVKPLTNVSSYYRRQVFTRTPAVGDAFVGGKELQFSFSASGNDWFVGSESRLVVKLNVRSTLDEAAGGSADIGGATGTHKRHPKKSVRFATAAPARLFSSGRVSIGGTTIENTGADLAEIATIQLRTEGTKPGEAAGGAAGLLGFDQTMTHPELAGGAGTVLAYNTSAPRSDKHQLLIDRRGNDLELSIPLGMLFTFFRQTDSFLPNMEFDVRLVVNPHFSNDALFTADLAAVPRAQGVEFAAVPNVVQAGTGDASAAPAALDLGWNAADAADRTFAQMLPAITAAANDSHKITVSECFIDAMYASPSIPLAQPLSMSQPFSGIIMYTRNLTAGQSSFTEVFSGLSASVSAVILALRVDDHALATNRELYLAGGDPAGGSFATAQLSIVINRINSDTYRVPTTTETRSSPSSSRQFRLPGAPCWTPTPSLLLRTASTAPSPPRYHRPRVPAQAQASKDVDRRVRAGLPSPVRRDKSQHFVRRGVSA